jgi:hypothetical protein
LATGTTTSGVVGDETCEREKTLVRDCLVHIADSRLYGAWLSFYRDPRDDRLWERYYPQGEMHGGGPPALRCISEHEAKANYEF